MRTEEFSKFVADQQQAEGESEVDWAEVRNEWLRNLDSLHRRVIEYLQEYIENKSISYGFTKIRLSEENIGEYTAKKMDIKIGRQRVLLEPVGTLLIGCKGRVDAIGSVGRAQILLVDERARTAADLIKVTVTVGKKGSIPRPPSVQKERISWAWKIVTNTAPRKFVDLDRESFLALLMEIANA